MIYKQLHSKIGFIRVYRRLILSIFLMTISMFSICKASAPEKPNWNQVLEALEDEERKALEFFFRVFFENSLGGYVLFGEKPICIESIKLNNCVEKFTGSAFSTEFHQKDIYLRKGYETWERLPLKSRKYLIRLFDEPFCGGKELIIANRNSIEKVVGENLSLFKYVLGPKLDVANFVESLEKTCGSFYGLVKNDRVLVGILLGYGVDNALRQSRREYIEEGLWEYEQILPLKSGRVKSELPNKKKKPELEEALFYHRNVESSSFTFSTILDEKKWLEKGHKLSLKKAHSKIAFPWFGYWVSKESEKILSSYLKSQRELEEILKSERFLEVVFEQLFD